MITEIVTFAVQRGISQEELLAKYRVTAEKWRSNPDLLHKQYFHDQHKSVGGGVYLWRSMEAATHWHGDAYCAMIRDTYGSEPAFQYFESYLIVDNVSHLVYDEPPRENNA